jgi:hypothetical protein
LAQKENLFHFKSSAIMPSFRIFGRHKDFVLHFQSICYHVSWANHHAYSHSSKQDAHPIVLLINKEATPYWTCGGTCCPRVSTSKIRSLADSSTTCHDGTNISTIPTFAQTTSSILTRSNHILTDRRPQHSHKDAS